MRVWLRTGKLRGYRPGADKLGWRVKESDLERYMEGTANRPAGTEVNGELATAPEKINKDAHSAWLIKITLKNPSELNSLLSAQDYEKFVSEEAGN